jgi:hypothetical protein
MQDCRCVSSSAVHSSVGSGRGQGTGERSVWWGESKAKQAESGVRGVKAG